MLSCKVPGCNITFTKKNKSNHILNCHSLEIKKKGITLGMRDNLEEAFHCSYCLANGCSTRIKTNQILNAHCRRHHSGSTMSCSESELKDLLSRSASFPKWSRKYASSAQRASSQSATTITCDIDSSTLQHRNRTTYLSSLEPLPCKKKLIARCLSENKTASEDRLDSLSCISISDTSLAPEIKSAPKDVFYSNHCISISDTFSINSGCTLCANLDSTASFLNDDSLDSESEMLEDNDDLCSWIPNFQPPDSRSQENDSTEVSNRADDEMFTLESNVSSYYINLSSNDSACSGFSDITTELQFVREIEESSVLELENLVRKENAFVRSLNLLPVRKQLLADMFATLPSSSMSCLIQACAWIKTLIDPPYLVLDLGSGSGKSGIGICILFAGFAKVLGFEIIATDTLNSMRSSHLYDKYLPEGLTMSELFIAFNDSIMSIKSADGCNVVYAQVRGMSDDDYHHIIPMFNNSNARVLIVSCHVSWSNFEKGVEKARGIRGTLVGRFKASCVGGAASTTFRVYYKDEVEQFWETDEYMQDCVSKLKCLTKSSAKEHLKMLYTQTGLP